MQVENNKEQVPFEHYVALFEKADAAEMAERTGVKWDGREFYMELFGEGYAISHPEYGIRKFPHPSCLRHATFSQEKVLPSPEERGDRAAVGVENAALPVQTFLLRFLLEGKAVAPMGSWKTFREMPWGELYIKPYTGRVLTRAAFTFGTRVAAFRAACEKMGAIPLSHGDAGYQLPVLGDYQMQIMVWEGDEEFPPNAQVLYSDNFETGFAPEDRVVAGDLLITAIKAKM